MRSFEEAEHLLHLLLKERGVRKEIVLYNLAQILRLQEDTEGFSRCLREAYEADKSMYRIRQPYQGVIDRIAAKFSNINIIDLEKIVSDNDYVDHCHPLPEAQKSIARHIVEKLNIPALKGDQPLEIKNHLYNPEYSLGNNSDFHSYFKTFAPFSSDEIKNFFSSLERSPSHFTESANALDSLLEMVPREISKAVEYYLKHPCFPQIKDAIMARPFFPSDVGRFPEYFLFRYLIPYLRAIERTAELARLFCPGKGLLRSSAEFISILPDPLIRSMEKDNLVFDLEYERVRLPAILEKIKRMLMEHLKQGNQIYERLKTTIFWYFRESLRFGAHSRISMRYERIPLEFMAEALAVAGVLDFNMGSERLLEIQRLKQWLEETVQTHEYFCRQFSLERDCRDLLNQYDLKLMDIAKRMEASSCQPQIHQEIQSR